MKEAVTEQKNELGTKNEVAAKPETRTLSSNPKDDESEEMKELATKKKNEMGEKNEGAGKPKAGFTPSSKLVQLLLEGHSHMFGLNAPNLKTKQDRIDAFMKTIAESVYTEEFDNQDKTLMKDRWYLEATSTRPLIAYKFNINFTIYNTNSAMTHYFYHYKYQNEEQIFCWINNGFCKPVVNSVVLILHDSHYYCIKAKGTEVQPLILEK